MKINNLFKDEYQCMFLNETNISLGKKYKELKIPTENFSDDKFLEYIKYRYVTVCFEKKGVGTLVFSNHIADNPFDILQKKYKEFPAYYFWASDTLGNFKILKDGKIQRKIASKGYVRDGFIGSEEQVIGKPCEYEIQNGKVYKMKYDEYTIKISKDEMAKMFDYYVPLNRNEDIVFDSIKLYYNIDHGNLKYELKDFPDAKFSQALIHIGKNYDYEFTKPLIIFKQKNILRSTFFKNKYSKFNLKNVKKLLKLGLFDKIDEKLRKTDLFFKPRFLMDYNFVSLFLDAITESLLPGEDYKTTYSEYRISFDEPGEYILKTSSIFYFSAEFIEGKFNIKIYSMMKNGKPVSNEFVAELNGFEKNELLVFYNQILDYIFDDNLAEYLLV